MSILTFPDALGAVKISWAQARLDMGFDSVFGSQGVEISSPLWAVMLEPKQFNRLNYADWEALLLKLRGQTNQLALWHLDRPAPLGTMRGTMTLNGAHAQGATTLVLKSSYGNLITAPETFSSWLSAGATVTPNTTTAPDGELTADTLIVDTGTNRHTIYGDYGVSAEVGEVSFSVFVPPSIGTRYLTIYLAGGGFQGPNRFGKSFDVTAGTKSSSGSNTAGVGVLSDSTITLMENGFYRCTITGTLAGSATDIVACIGITNTANAVGHIVNSYLGDGTSGLKAWGAKLEYGAVSDYGHNKTLVAGDLLGLGSGTTQQVVKVVDPSTSISEGLITVNVESWLRNAFADNTPVTWDKPKALFRRKGTETRMDHTRGGVSGIALDLIEDWRP